MDKHEGIKELLDDISPIEDSRFELSFISHTFKEPEHSEEECIFLNSISG